MMNADMPALPEAFLARMRAALGEEAFAAFLQSYARPVCRGIRVNTLKISREEFEKNHSGIPHGGFVIRSGYTGMNNENKHIIEYSLKLDSNPEFTSSVLVAYARAAYRMSAEGHKGCKTVFDIPPAYLSPKTGEEIRKSLL